MHIDSIPIDDTFAEAFRMRFTRLIITAASETWVEIACREVSGYGSSIIACDAETGIERPLGSDETPDGRPGIAILLFGFSTAALAEAVCTRIGQCVLTCPTTAVYSGIPSSQAANNKGEKFALGKHLRFFGDGFQKSKVVEGRRFWRIPVMDGEFLVEDEAVSCKGIGGGNFFVQGRTQAAALEGASAAVAAIAAIDGVITPFPGGIARSGSKVGSMYKQLRASTNEAYCPTLRARATTHIHAEANAVYEIIINGIDEERISTAIRQGIKAACADNRADIVAISAGNYGGKLGKFHFHLHEVLQ